MKKDKLKGVTISSELVLLNFLGVENFFVSVSPFFQELKKNKINTPFISTSCFDRGRATASCCFATEDLEPVQLLIQTTDSLKSHARFTHGVGLVTVFPHRSSLNILGLSLSALKEANLSVLGMASSISSLVFVVEYHHLATAVDSLKSFCFSIDGTG